LSRLTLQVKFNKDMTQSNIYHREQIQWVIEWLLFNANWAIFQLYLGRNKLHFDETIMIFALH
jgi:hypothetical protein